MNIYSLVQTALAGNLVTTAFNTFNTLSDYYFIMAVWPASAFTPDKFNIPTSDGDIIDFAGAYSEWDVFRAPETGRGGRISYGTDVSIIREMMDAVEEEWEKDLDRKIRILGEAIQAMDNVSDFKSARWFGRGDSWNRLYPGPEEDDEWVDYRVWAHFMLWPLEGEIPEALDQADEDMEYEKWINSRQYIKSLEEYNFHKLLAFEKGYSPHWIGECTGDEGILQAGDVILYNTMLKDRFRVQCVIKTEFPISGGNRAYAKATSPFGDIYIPNKFNGYIGSPGSPALMSVSLQDVGGGGRKGNGYRWTCIYTH